MKGILIGLFLLSVSSAQSQILDGTLVDEGRKLLTQTNFQVEGTVAGYAIYTLAVDRDGKVTGLTLEDTNIKSTPTKVMVRNYLSSFKFTGASNYPPHQHVRVRINSVVKP